jgi:hypothetical protein
MINLPNVQQPIVEENNIVKPEWNTFFQQIKTAIKTDLLVDIGVPNAGQPLAKENGEIDSVWFSFFEKSYKTTGATFGLPSAQEKLGRNWSNFFQSMYQELK